jgi:hypothetical protein
MHAHDVVAIHYEGITVQGVRVGTGYTSLRIVSIGGLL